MNRDQHIHGAPATFSVSYALETLGEDLLRIKTEDKLTWKEVGRVLGKSDDRAADYATAISEMGVGAFLLGCKEWKGRLAGRTFALIRQQLAPSDGADMTDNERLSHLLHLAHLLSLALLDDGEVDESELKAIGGAALENAARGIGSLRARLRSIEQAEARKA